MIYNTTASVNTLMCTNSVDFGNFQDRFRRFSWSEINPNYLDVKFKVFKKDYQDFRLVQNPIEGEADINFKKMKAIAIFKIQLCCLDLAYVDNLAKQKQCKLSFISSRLGR